MALQQEHGRAAAEMQAEHAAAILRLEVANETVQQHHSEQLAAETAKVREEARLERFTTQADNDRLFSELQVRPP